MNELSRIGESGPWVDPHRAALDEIERIETIRACMGVEDYLEVSALAARLMSEVDGL